MDQGVDAAELFARLPNDCFHGARRAKIGWERDRFAVPIAQLLGSGFILMVRERHARIVVGEHGHEFAADGAGPTEHQGMESTR
jgi:hypothetical protein